MSSSETRIRAEADSGTDRHITVEELHDRAEVPVGHRTPTFDVSTLPPPASGWRRLVQRADIPVQLARLALLGALLLLWQTGVEREWVNRIFAATPGEVWNSLTSIIQTRLFWEDTMVTLREATFGFVIGGSLGLVAGLVTGRYTRLGKVVNPFLTFANSLPKIAFAPIFLLWFGVGEQSKVVLAVVVVFFIVQIPTQAAVGLIDPDLDLVVASMGATEREKFVKVVLPGILAPVFGALRLAVIFSLLSVVFAEILGAKRGLGLRLITAKNNFAIDDMFAYTIVLALLALTLNGILGMLERRALRWQEAGGGGQVISI